MNENASTTNMHEKKVCHPFVCRLSSNSVFEISPMLLIRAGYASLAVALFTLFRPTPVILYKVIDLLHISGEWRILIISLLFSWSGLLIACLLVFGSVLLASNKIKRRHPLMLHPWVLLLLYLDAFVWLTLVLLLYDKVHKNPHYIGLLTKMFTSKNVIFIFMFVEICIFLILHYIYATYFIIAELTAIELFF